MKVYAVEQNSVDWMILRSGVITASEFDNILTPEFKARSGETPKTYMAKKLSEVWLGGPIASLNTFDMEQGHILEQEAIPFYELETGEVVQRVGFITNDEGSVGCSPDGLLGEHSGIEIKCPAIHTHVGYLLNGTLPKDYAAQVHGAMFVTGRPQWKFLSYRRNLPPLLLTIERDETIQSRIREALTDFIVNFNDAMKRLLEINGGPPKRRKPQFVPVTQK
jgi:hypothetical protein